MTLDEALEALREPFAPSDFCQDGDGKQNYIPVTRIYDRLDSVVGQGWWCEEYDLIATLFRCNLRLEIPGKYITHVGFGDCPFVAFVHAAKKFGIARHDIIGEMVPFTAPKSSPKAPVPVEPPETKFSETAPSARPAPDLRTREDVPAPSTGRALYKWAKDCEQAHGWAVVKYINDWAKLQGGWPGKMVEWSPEQVKVAFAEVLRKKPDLAPAAVAKESDDPLGIASDDTLNGLKMFVRAAALQFARRRLGLSDREHPGGREVIAEINRVAGSDGTIRSLADCSDARLLQVILDRFNAETEALHAVKG